MLLRLLEYSKGIVVEIKLLFTFTYPIAWNVTSFAPTLKEIMSRMFCPTILGLNLKLNAMSVVF